MRAQIIATIATMFSSCVSHRAKQDQGPVGGASRSNTIVQWDGSGAQSFRPNIVNSGTPADLALALSDCDCAPLQSAKILTSHAISTGVVPQILVPSVRVAIANDSKLKILNSLPSLFGDSLKSWFANDQKIATSIRDDISDKMQTSLASFGGTTLENRQAFRLDLFDPMATSPVAFDVNDQVARWNLVAGRKEMWAGGKPLDGIDHGIQLLETVKMSAEWAYLFGIGANGKPNGYGGLVLDSSLGNSRLSPPVDPSIAPATYGPFASGILTIAYPNASSVTLATQIRETWSFQPNTVPLLMQARIWNAAAKAFNNFNYNQSPGARVILQAYKGVIDAGVIPLPLVWLAGMNQLLDLRFVDKTTRVIHEDAYGSTNPASLEALVTLAHALQNWRTGAQNAANSGLTPDLAAKLNNVPDKLLVVIQLIVQNILARYTYATDGNSSQLYVSNLSDSTQSPASAKLAAETIQLLAELDQKSLASPDLRQSVFSLYASHAALWAHSPVPSDAPTVIAQLKLARTIAAYGSAAPAWNATLAQNLEGSVQAWAGTP